MDSTATVYIGRVAISEETPASFEEFWCWLSKDEVVEIGTPLIIEKPNRESGDWILGVVEDIKYTSTPKGLPQEFFSHRYGNPSYIPPTEPTIIKQIRIRTLFKEPNTRAPPSGRLVARRVTKDDFHRLWSALIPEEFRVLAGFSHGSDYFPVYLHSEFLLGPEGAHVNISGTTGLAAKTSYALFLALSVLAWGMKSGKKPSIILFNVKRDDFLGLHNIPNSEGEISDWIDAWKDARGLSDEQANKCKSLWHKAFSEGIDPIKLFGTEQFKIRYFTFPGDPSEGDKDKMKESQRYYYGLGDITSTELIAALYAEEDPPIQQINLLESIIRRVREENLRLSFDQINLLLEYGQVPNTSETRQQKDRIRQAVIEGNMEELIDVVDSYDSKTVSALFRRLNGLLSRAGRILELRNVYGRPISFESIEPGLNVIQLYGLSEVEKRIVVNAVMRRVVEGLEQGGNEEGRRITKVVFVIDELNLYAPKAKSPIKDQIIEIVARGRDLGLSLIGCEQFASYIDTQVYGNSQTKVLGRTESVELTHDMYRYLGTFKDKVPLFEKGQMLLYNPLYLSPYLISFPPPLPELYRAYKRNRVH